MKKIVFILLNSLLMFSLVACTEPTDVKSGQNNDNNKVGDPDKKAILVVSFGTSYNETRALTIDAIEKIIADNYKDYDVRRAFTSQIIIDKLEKRDGLKINNVDEAMKQLVKDNIGTLVVQPTHIMNGIEYDQMKASVEPYIKNFKTVVFGNPLLSTVEDYNKLIDAFRDEIAVDIPKDTALVLMGHGTEHYANAAYATLDYIFKDKGMNNVFVGTVESYPDLETVKRHVKDAGYNKVIIEPLMVVAGDHANNDMAGDEDDSWKSEFEADGFEVKCILKGLGEFKSIHNIYVDHVGNAIDLSNSK